MGGVSRYFSKVSGSGVDVTLLILSMLKATVESHDSSRTIPNRPILDSESPIQCHQNQGVFAEKGARFHGKWGLGAPPHPRPLLLAGGGGFTENPGGGVFQEGGAGGPARGVHGEFGGGGGRGRRGPIYRENEPPFRRKRLNPFILGGGGGFSLRSRPPPIKKARERRSGA